MSGGNVARPSALHRYGIIIRRKSRYAYQLRCALEKPEGWAGAYGAQRSILARAARPRMPGSAVLEVILVFGSVLPQDRQGADLEEMLSS